MRKQLIIKVHQNKDAKEKKYWWFTIVSPNGKKLCHSETYHKRSGVMKTIDAIVECLGSMKYKIQG